MHKKDKELYGTTSVTNSWKVFYNKQCAAYS
jgi:hypothetical protein